MEICRIKLSGRSIAEIIKNCIKAPPLTEFTIKSKQYHSISETNGVRSLLKIRALDFDIEILR